MELGAGITPPVCGRAEGLHFAHRPAGRDGPVEVGLLAAGPIGPGAPGELRAGAAFLLDSALGAVTPGCLARMIGCFFFACAAGRGHGAVQVTLRQGAEAAAASLARPAFEVEVNGFGAAHVLYEDEALGLYVLEVAPGAAIPAHFHRVMQESELVLDAGLLQQGRPVRAGDAFHWPAGYVHEYRNPTDGPKRILCIDRPRFIPEDEVLVAGPVALLPARPSRNYLA